MAKRVSLTRAGEMPEVEAAGSDERTAVMARPDADRCRLCMSRVTISTMISRTTARLRSSDRWMGPTLGRLIGQPV